VSVYVCIKTCNERKLQEQGVGECYAVRGFIICAVYKIVIEGQHNGGLMDRKCRIHGEHVTWFLLIGIKTWKEKTTREI